MGTKNDPGDVNEGMFVLLGRDRHASALLRLWAMLREMDSLLAMAASRLDAQQAGAAPPVAPPMTPEELAAPLVVGDVVVSGSGGRPARLDRLFGDDAPEPMRGLANVVFPRAAAPVTMVLAQLRRALPDEVDAYRKATQGN